MNKIANISLSVHDIFKVGFAQIAPSPTFFNISAWNFQDMRWSAFCARNGAGVDSWFGLKKNLVAKFQHLRVHFPEFGRQFFLRPKPKIRPDFRREMYFHAYPENFRQKNIEKYRRRSHFSEAHFGNIANWDIGNFVHFCNFSDLWFTF